MMVTNRACLIIWLSSSNMLNPNQDTGVDDIFEQHAEATSLIDTPVTAIVEPSFSAQTNRPPTPNPLVIQIQQPPILTPATTTSSSLQNLPNFASLFGFDYRLKALEDNFSELRQTNQYAEALSSIPGIVDNYLANKLRMSWMLQSIELVIEQLESEVLIRSSKEAKTSHAVAANLSELELKKILNKDGSKQLYQQVQTFKDISSKAVSRCTGGPKEEDSQAISTNLLPVEETMQTTDVFEAPAHQEFETGVYDEQAEEEVQHLPDWFQQPTRLPSPDHTWNKSVLNFHEISSTMAKQSGTKTRPSRVMDEQPTLQVDYL
ncbi:hypothetical protein Tco_0902079 [Tanacetum coccineum]